MFDKSMVRKELVTEVQELIQSHNNSIRRINQSACEAVAKFLGVEEASEIVGAFYKCESDLEGKNLPFTNFKGIDENDMRFFVELTLTCERD